MVPCATERMNCWIKVIKTDTHMMVYCSNSTIRSPDHWATETDVCLGCLRVIHTGCHHHLPLFLCLWLRLVPLVPHSIVVWTCWFFGTWRFGCWVWFSMTPLDFVPAGRMVRGESLLAFSLLSNAARSIRAIGMDFSCKRTLRTRLFRLLRLLPVSARPSGVSTVSSFLAHPWSRRI